MEKGIISASLLLLGGAVVSRFDAVWGEVFGLFGILVAVICGACVAGLWAMKEIEKERCK